METKYFQTFKAPCSRCGKTAMIVAKTIGGAIRKATLQCNCKPGG